MQTPAETVAELARLFPMPGAELERLKKRSWVLKELPPGGVGAEIGVFRGHFSEMICRIVQPRKLFLVDPWTLIGERFGWGGDYTCDDRLTTATARTDALARAAGFPKTEIVAIEGWFPRCAAQITEPLDFAYLDASHRYASTLNELRKLDALVKPDGLILGDDWSPRPDSKHHGVYRAVQSFVRERDWEIVKAGAARQWILRRRKPE